MDIPSFLSTLTSGFSPGLSSDSSTGLSTGLSTFLLVFMAELGDKSQLVCMTLAASYRARPVLLGAIVAFLILNLIAVILGASFAQWIPQTALKLFAAALFLLFAYQTIKGAEEDENEGGRTLKYGVLVSTFLLIFVAEMGDKTQIAVATLSMTQSPLLVWISASLALSCSCILGVFAGKRWLSRIDERKLNIVTATLFAVFAVMILLSLLST